jgi:hypothetical protein
LPCDPFNYSYEYGRQVASEDLGAKAVIHLKGGRKTDLQAALQVIQQGRVDRFVSPNFVLWNKQYREWPFADKETRSKFVGTLQVASSLVDANTPQSSAALVDDLFVWFRSLHFLKNADFIEAMGTLAEDPVLRARIWRVYTLCWAAKSCMSVDGDFLDIGCYDGKTVSVMSRYCRFSEQDVKKYWLFDMFEDPPEESRKVGHGPELFHQVRSMFPDEARFKIVKGPVPGSMMGNLPDRIAFAQIDLNAAEPELAALELIFDRMQAGGMIVFDDFGFSRYRETHDLEVRFMRDKGLSILESPTGQGIFIKR